MTEKQRKSLLRVVRKVIETTVRGEAVSEYESEDSLFNAKRGCFVTIHNHGQLRGCIGRFEPEEKLIKVVREMAISATRDPRFVMNPVTPAELQDLREIHAAIKGGEAQWSDYVKAEEKPDPGVERAKKGVEEKLRGKANGLP